MSLQGHREHHAKTGSGALSQSQIEKIRKDRVKNLTLSSVDLSKDPFFLKNHIGTYECKLCLTSHNNEGNYLAHTQGKRHQAKLAKRLEMEKERELRKKQRDQGLEALKSTAKVHKKTVRIGRPGYNVQKRRGEHGENVLIFHIEYPEITAQTNPMYRFLSAFEQKVDMPPDPQYQYLVIAADPYETIAFKVPNIPIDMDRIVKRWHAEQRIFALKVYFDNPQQERTDNMHADDEEIR